MLQLHRRVYKEKYKNYKMSKTKIYRQIDFLCLLIRVESRCNSLMEKKWHCRTNNKEKTTWSFSDATSSGKFWIWITLVVGLGVEFWVLNLDSCFIMGLGGVLDLEIDILSLDSPNKKKKKKNEDILSLIRPLAQFALKERHLTLLLQFFRKCHNYNFYQKRLFIYFYIKCKF